MLSRIGIFAAIAACLFLTGGSLMAHDPHDPMQVVAISPNFAQDQTILAATGGLTLKLGVMVIFKSTDGGVNWTIVTGLPNNSPVYAVLFSPNYSNDSTVFVAGSGGLFVSTDGTSSWTTLSTDQIVSLALSPNFANDNTLFLVTNQNKVYGSTSRGTNLTPLSAPLGLTSALTVIAISPTFDTDRSLLLGSAANGIFKSGNGGQTWLPVTKGLALPKVTTLAFSPSYTSDQTTFAGTMGKGFLVSTNRGITWQQSNTGLTDTNVSNFAFSATYSQDSTLWVTTAVAGVFQSTNSGTSWGAPVTVSRQLSSLTDVHYQTLAVYPGIQFLGMFEGLWTSVNGGASWQYIDTCPTRFVRYINMSPSYPADQTIFVSTYGSGNLWTTNGGTSWTLQNNGMVAPYTDGSGISPNFSLDGTAFSGNHLGLQRTTDFGATWQMMYPLGTDEAPYPRGFAVAPNFSFGSNNQTVYIGTTSAAGHTDVSHGSTKVLAGLYVSTNAGENWTLSSLRGDGVVCIAFSPNFANDQTAFAGTQQNGVYMTTNSAATWTPLTLPGNPKGIAVVAVSPNYLVDQTLFAAGLHGGLYKSSNGGSTWTLIPNTRTIRGLDIKFSPNFANDQTLFMGTIQSGLMESTNGGTTVSQVTSFPDVFVSALGVSSGFQTDQTIFAAAYHGLYESTDGGSTWTYLVTPARIEESRNIASVLQEPPTITYQGEWSMITPTLYASTNQYAASTPESQDTAALQFLGTGVDWVSITGEGQGSASITLDGVFQTTVELNPLNSSQDSYLQTVWTQQGLPCGIHTVTITASPAVTQSVALDAFDIWINACPYTPGGDPPKHH